MTTIKSILTALDQGKYLDKDGVDGALRDIQQLIEKAKPFYQGCSVVGRSHRNGVAKGRNDAIDEFEANLKKIIR